MTFKEFVSEIKSDLTKYDNVGLIDELVILKEVYRGLKKFGTFSKIIFETTIKIENNRGSLPLNFDKLELAIKCDPFQYEIIEKDVELEKRIWTELERDSVSWDSCDECCKTYSKSCIEETVYLKTRKPKARFLYSNPSPLKLVKGVQRDICSNTCKNLFVDSPYEISIRSNKIYTNFKTGTVFLRYYGFPQDQEGLPYIPDSELGSLEAYLENKVKLKILEDVLINGHATQSDYITQIMARFDQKDRDLYLKAMTELKMENIFSDLEEYSDYIKNEFEFKNYEV